jgi:colanic acid/amylovoran biosynthesis glycosyltransferase
MRVAYLINQYPAVSHTFIRREINALEAIGVEVVRLALHGWRETPVDLRDLEEQRKTVYVLKAGGFSLLAACLTTLVLHPRKFARAFGDAFALSRGGDRPIWIYLIYLFEACWIVRYLIRMNSRGQAVDHLHAHFGTNPAAIALLVQTVGGPPYSFTVHGPEEFDRPQALKLGFKAARAKSVIAVSAFGRSQLYRWLALSDWRKVVVVRCGLETSYFESTPKSTPLESWQAHRKAILCIGRLSEQKGHLTLIEAAALLQQRGVPFDLVFAGDGDLRSDIERRIDDAGLRSTVRITGWISSDKVREEISLACVIVVPSFAEGLPVVIMEAMALGKPVISTYVAGIPELVQNGKTGFLIPASDSGALADAIQKLLLMSAESLAEMGQEGKLRVVEMHSISRSAIELLEIFSAKQNPFESSAA